MQTYIVTETIVKFNDPIQSGEITSATMICHLPHLVVQRDGLVL